MASDKKTGAENPFQELCKINEEEILARTGGKVFELFKTPSKFQPKVAKRTPKRKIGQDDNTENKQRPRTSSGQIISSTVCEIKRQYIKATDQNSRGSKECKCKKVDDSAHSCIKCEVADKHEHRMSAPNTERDQTGTDELLSMDTLEVNLTNVFNKHEEMIKEQGAISMEMNDVNQTSSNMAHQNTTVYVRTVVKMLGDLKVEIADVISREIKKQMEEVKQIVINSVDGGSSAADKTEIEDLKQKHIQTTSQVNVNVAMNRMLTHTLAGDEVCECFK